MIGLRSVDRVVLGHVIRRGCAVLPRRGELINPVALHEPPCLLELIDVVLVLDVLDFDERELLAELSADPTKPLQIDEPHLIRPPTRVFSYFS